MKKFQIHLYCLHFCRVFQIYIVHSSVRTLFFIQARLTRLNIFDQNLSWFCFFRRFILKRCAQGLRGKSLMKNPLSKKNWWKKNNAILTFYAAPDMDQKKIRKIYSSLVFSVFPSILSRKDSPREYQRNIGYVVFVPSVTY